MKHNTLQNSSQEHEKVSWETAVKEMYEDIETNDFSNVLINAFVSKNKDNKETYDLVCNRYATIKELSYLYYAHDREEGGYQTIINNSSYLDLVNNDLITVKQLNSIHSSFRGNCKNRRNTEAKDFISYVEKYIKPLIETGTSIDNIISWCGDNPDILILLSMHSEEVLISREGLVQKIYLLDPITISFLTAAMGKNEGKKIQAGKWNNTTYTVPKGIKEIFIKEDSTTIDVLISDKGFSLANCKPSIKLENSMTLETQLSQYKKSPESKDRLEAFQIASVSKNTIKKDGRDQLIKAISKVSDKSIEDVKNFLTALSNYKNFNSIGAMHCQTLVKKEGSLEEYSQIFKNEQAKSQHTIGIAKSATLELMERSTLTFLEQSTTTLSQLSQLSVDDIRKARQDFSATQPATIAPQDPPAVTPITAASLRESPPYTSHSQYQQPPGVEQRFDGAGLAQPFSFANRTIPPNPVQIGSQVINRAGGPFDPPQPYVVQNGNIIAPQDPPEVTPITAVSLRESPLYTSHSQYPQPPGVEQRFYEAEQTQPFPFANRTILPNPVQIGSQVINRAGAPLGLPQPYVVQNENLYQGLPTLPTYDRNPNVTRLPPLPCQSPAFSNNTIQTLLQQNWVHKAQLTRSQEAPPSTSQQTNGTFRNGTYVNFKRKVPVAGEPPKPQQPPYQSNNNHSNGDNAQQQGKFEAALALSSLGEWQGR